MIVIISDTVACYAGINVSVRQVGVSGWAGVFGCHHSSTILAGINIVE